MATLAKETKKRKLIKKSKPETPSKKTKKAKTLDKEQRRRGHDTDSDDESDSEKLTSLLEPYSKDQLMDLICDAAAKDPSLFGRVRDLADRDIAHRKIFVHGLGWDTAKETLASAFEPFGEVEECNVVLDKTTGKAKGYGFVLFATRRGAVKALKSPQKKINGRVASCQLASLGPGAAVSPASGTDSAAGRKIYVSNVPAETDVVQFREFFARFGELEAGPIGFDVQTGKSRGFALFVYRTPEGFKKALQEPYKMFQGHQLHCQKAAEGKGKNLQPPPKPQAPTQQPAQQPISAPRPMPPQNLAFFNPMIYGVGGGFVPGSVNPMGIIPTGQFAGYSVGSSSANPNANALPQVYPSVAQFGPAGGSTGAYPSSYVW